MSLKSFVKMRDVSNKIKPLRPKFPRRIPVPLKVGPRTGHYMVVGTAFDYLLRFELQRRAPHAKTGPLVAESAPDWIWRQSGSVACYTNLTMGAGPDERMDPYETERAAKEMSGRARGVVEKAQTAVAAYTKNRSPMPSEQADLAGHAIRLAKLDDVYRAGRLDPGFEDADPADVQDLLALLAVVPFDQLLHDKALCLNPTFGNSSLLVGGADADLITGDLLVDLKTTKAGEMQAVDLDQLLGYFLLARHERLVDPTFPEVRRLGLYFCRHGHLWSVDATAWTGHPQFAEVEKWFFEKAQEVFGGKTPAPQGQPEARRSGRGE